MDYFGFSKNAAEAGQPRHSRKAASAYAQTSLGQISLISFGFLSPRAKTLVRLESEKPASRRAD